MSKFDEFDLDVQNLKGEGDVTPHFSWVDITLIISTSLVTGCTPDCLTTKCDPHQPSIDSPCGSGGYAVY